MNLDHHERRNQRELYSQPYRKHKHRQWSVSIHEFHQSRSMNYTEMRVSKKNSTLCHNEPWYNYKLSKYFSGLPRYSFGWVAWNIHCVRAYLIPFFWSTLSKRRQPYPKFKLIVFLNVYVGHWPCPLSVQHFITRR